MTDENDSGNTKMERDVRTILVVVVALFAMEYMTFILDLLGVLVW